MKAFPILTALALPALSVAFAARIPANLEPFAAQQVCIGRAEVLLKGELNAAMTKVAQDRLDALGASLKLGKDYTSCPAWLTFHAEAGNDGNGRFVYQGVLSLVAPKLQTKALESLRHESFDYDGGFEFITLWDRADVGVITGQDSLSFAIGAEVVSHMGDFSVDWKKTH
ncbi:hypothetical protein [Deinococcus yavapaiensis]|nr:hypothetical protein [Deinococcus yavapaiensis]